MPIKWNQYDGGFRKRGTGYHFVGFTERGSRTFINPDRAIRFTTKQILTCGVAAATLLLCGTCASIVYFANLPQPHSHSIVAGGLVVIS